MPILMEFESREELLAGRQDKKHFGSRQEMLKKQPLLFIKGATTNETLSQSNIAFCA